MRKLFLHIFFYLILISSCSRKEVQVPAGVIPRDTMVNVLADIHLVEATIQLKNLGRNDTLKEEAYGRYKFVFQKYHLTENTFRKSLDFYHTEPEYFQHIYEDVLVRLSEEQAKQGRIRELNKY